MNLMSYRNLGQPGGPEFSEAEVQAIAGNRQVTDGPDDNGEMFQRPGVASDRFVAPFPNEQAARAANAGVYPPDLTLITKSRAGWEGSLATFYTTTLFKGIGGPQYVYSVLTGYEQTPPELADQQPDIAHYNPYFTAAPWIAMPPPLTDGAVEYGDGTEATVDQMARDVSAFLAWAAEPTLEERKRIGFQVLLYMAVLTVLLFLIKNMIWSRCTDLVGLTSSRLTRGPTARMRPAHALHGCSGQARASEICREEVCMTQAVLGIIGGSGFYDVALDNARTEKIDSPWGAPSEALRLGEMGGLPVAFLPRHGRGHPLSPSDINYRANIDVLKRAGVTDLVSISACGSFREELPPGTFVIVDQFIDRTFARPKSFFGPGCVAHVSLAEPISPRLADAVEAAAKAEAIRYHRGGTYLAMEGPQFSTLAESKLYRSWGCDVIGMTNMPEAKLAREAEICYATVAMVTDFDSWHPDHGSVDITSIIEVMQANADGARRLVARLAADFPREHQPCPIGSDTALEHAILTAPDARDPALLAKLDAVAGRVLNRG
jgi:5'-methylthioadenosine phosphorylase